MMTSHLATVAQLLASGGRGILSVDEPRAALDRRFGALGIPATPERRRAFRELIVGAPLIERYAGAMILDDETLRQSGSDGRRFTESLRRRDVVPGIALDAATPFGELRAHLAECAALGAGFARLHAAPEAVDALAHAALVSQRSGIVPIVAPAVAANGDRERTLRRTFAALAESGVALDAMVLECPPAPAVRAEPPGVAEVVAGTLRALGATVPVAVAAIAFVADDTDERGAAEQLCALNRTAPRRRPWPLTFTYGRGLQLAALDAWRGRDERVDLARRNTVHRAYCSGLAACGAYSAKAEASLYRVKISLAA